MPFRILTLGDSILWGQGLTEPHKWSSRLAAELAAQGAEPEVIRFAHSGACAWDPNHTGILDYLDPTPPPLLPAPVDLTEAQIRASAMPGGSAAARDAGGEVPSRAPFTLAQLVLAKDLLGGTSPELIVVDGGINDVGIWNIVFPQKDAYCLATRVDSYKGYTLNLLQRAHTYFPTSKIVVTGYYPILSEESDVPLLRPFHKAFIEAVAKVCDPWPALGFDSLEHAVADAITGIPYLKGLFGSVESPEAHLIRLSKVWNDRIHPVLADDVASFNAAAGAEVARLAIPAFTPAGSLYAPQSLLWDLDTLVEPRDEVVAARAVQCQAAVANPVEAFICHRASAGHPNLDGERVYFEAIKAAALGLGAIQ